MKARGTELSHTHIDLPNSLPARFYAAAKNKAPGDSQGSPNLTTTTT